MEQSFEKLNANYCAENNKQTDLSWDNMPPELLVKIFPGFRFSDLYSASLVSKKFNVIANLSLTELGNIVQAAKEHDIDLIIAHCKSSLKYTQAVVMSSLRQQLSEYQLIQIALTSLKHAEIILKSDYIYRYDETSTLGSPVGILASVASRNNDFAKIVLKHVLLRKETAELLLALAKNNRSFAMLVAENALTPLSTNQLVELAETNIHCAAKIFANREAFDKLRSEHITVIAKSSVSHLQYIIENHLEHLDVHAIKHLIEVSDEYAEKIRQILVSLVAVLSRVYVAKAPQASMTVLALIVKGEFFTDSNPAWIEWKLRLPEITKRIVYAIKLYQRFFIQHNLTKALIIFLMDQSVKFSQVVFAIPKMSAILGEDVYHALKNEFEHSLDNTDTLENTVLSFIR